MSHLESTDKSREAPEISVLHGCEEVGGKVYSLSAQ